MKVINYLLNQITYGSPAWVAALAILSVLAGIACAVLFGHA